MKTPLTLDAFARAAMLGLLASQSVGCSGSCGDGEPSPASTETGSTNATSDGTTNGAGTTEEEDASGVLSSKVVPDLTLAAFTLECQEAGGVVETHASCGGVNSCRGFSYDSDTEVFTEHTCRGYNTCSGFSCVVPEAT